MARGFRERRVGELVCDIIGFVRLEYIAGSRPFWQEEVLRRILVCVNSDAFSC